MSLHDTPHLNSTRRRARKQQLARRHGQRCAYCARPFASLREATLDHVVPLSLFRTWSAAHLTLACRPCNDAKADRLPLSMALLLLRSVDPDRPVIDPTALPLLARLAHISQTALTSVTTRVTPGVTARVAASAPDLTHRQSTSGQHESTGRGHRVRPSGRPDCLRARRAVRVCGRPTGEAVPA